LIFELGDKAVEPDQIEEERILARAGEGCDAGSRLADAAISGAVPQRQRRRASYRRQWRYSGSPLSGEPFHDDTVRNDRPVCLAKGSRAGHERLLPKGENTKSIEAVGIPFVIELGLVLK
jgi:hypothetical protein